MMHRNIGAFPQSSTFGFKRRSAGIPF